MKNLILSALIQEFIVYKVTDKKFAVKVQYGLFFSGWLRIDRGTFSLEDSIVDASLFDKFLVKPKINGFLSYLGNTRSYAITLGKIF